MSCYLISADEVFCQPQWQHRSLHTPQTGDYNNALKDCSFVCDRIDVGCSAYQDPNWVRTVRRWPPSIAIKLEQFLARELPEVLKGKPGSILAPVSSSSIK